MSDNDLIQASLELVAERHGDPTEAVYARLFAQHPDVRELFLPGREQARGSMLMNVLDLIGDEARRDIYGRNLFRAEIVNHQGLGVPPEVFITFLNVVLETFEELLGPEWTPGTDAAWRRIIDELHREVAPERAWAGEIRDGTALAAARL